MLFRKRTTLELAITDFCNLDCHLCSQATPLQKDKSVMSIEALKKISSLVKPFEFQTIKISGGEPTLHPEFVQICLQLKKLFPAKRYVLATNGFKLADFKDCLNVFDQISLVHYPGKNDEVFKQILELKLPNVVSGRKRDYLEMEDVYQEKNINKSNIYNKCIYSKIKKIVDGKIYPCCVIFGQSLRKNIDRNTISVAMDESWRSNLAKVNIENFCKRCFVDVADTFWKKWI